MGNKITFSVKEFLSGKQRYQGVSVPFPIEQATTEQPSQSVAIDGGGGIEDLADQLKVLVPQEPLPGFLVDGIAITGMGFVDGMLHVQADYGDITRTDNHGFFHLQDAAGNQVKSLYNAYFRQEKNGAQVYYCEFVFDVPHNSLENYALFGDFVVSKQLTEGSWQVTFPIA